MKEVRFQGGPWHGILRAVPDDATHVSVVTHFIPAGIERAIGFYGPSASVPDGVWKWNGLYD